MRQIYPALRACPPAAPWGDAPWGAERRRIAMNVVTTVDGRAAIAGGSHGIGSATDHALMLHLRAGADAVIVGSGTVSAEKVSPGVPAGLEGERRGRGLRPQPLTVLLSGRRGARPRGRLASLGPERLVIFAPAGTERDMPGVPAAMHATAGDRPDPAEVVRVLRDVYGATALLVEGGPRICGAFLAAGLVDEVFWTVAPKLAGGGDEPRMIEGPRTAHGPYGLQLLAAYEHAGELYLRYRVQYGDG